MKTSVPGRIALPVLSLSLALGLAGCARDPAPAPVHRADVVAAINGARQKAGLHPVETASLSVTHRRAETAWPHRNGDLSAGHRGFAGAVDAANLPGEWSGEALYRGPAQSSAQEIVTTWMASPGHRAILLKPGASVCSASSAADARLAVAALVCAGAR